MDGEFVKWMASLGVGGAIAAVIFHGYRKDVGQYIAQWKGQSESLIAVVRENTAALTNLATLITAMHRRLDIEEQQRRDAH